MERRETNTTHHNILSPGQTNGPTPPGIQVDTLYSVLAVVGLQSYFPSLIEAGFDNWRSVCRITEHDLERLGFKLGHRRLLQRKIAESQGHPTLEPLPSAARKLYMASSSATENLSDNNNNGPSEGGKEAKGYAPRKIKQNDTPSGIIVESIERDTCGQWRHEHPFHSPKRYPSVVGVQWFWCSLPRIISEPMDKLNGTNLLAR